MTSHQPLTPAETERGWVEFHCDKHGFLVATMPEATVFCSCGKKTRMLRHGRLIHPTTLKPTRAMPREANHAGHGRLHFCSACGEDFRSLTLFARHRAGQAAAKRCLTPAEMEAKKWGKDDHGRWRDRRNGSVFSTASTTREIEAESTPSAPSGPIAARRTSSDV